MDNGLCWCNCARGKRWNVLGSLLTFSVGQDLQGYNGHMHVVMSFMTSSWYMYTTQAYSSYSVYTSTLRKRSHAP